MMGAFSPVRQDLKSGSAEGMVEKLADANGAARILHPDELSHLLEKAKIDRSSFPSVLTSAFYKNKVSLTVAGRRQLEFDCALSILGGLLDTEFGFLFGRSTTGGLYDRFVFGLCPAPCRFSFRPFDGLVEQTAPVSVSIAPEVWDLLRDWQKIPGANPRVAEISLRVAKICASFNGRAMLRATDEEITAAKVFFQEQTHLRRILQPNPGENSDAVCAFAILSTLEMLGAGAWVKQRDLYRRIHGERFGPGIFSRSLQQLTFNGEVERRADVIPGGKNWQLRKLVLQGWPQ
jgi:hypothetical protein